MSFLFFGNKSKIQIGEANAQILQQLQAIETKESCILSSIGTLNDLLQFMTRLDYVKDMIDDARIQADLIEKVAASSEEMAAATEEISSAVQSSNLMMNRAVEETHNSLQQVEHTFNDVENNIDEMAAVKNIMLEVEAETFKINNLVGVIKSVADQTNLLSLNASIEAARAGESGKGFAVVAGEVKQLANSTKEQGDVIRTIVDELNSKIERASNEIERIISNFQKSKSAIDNTTGSIKSITTTIDAVGESFSEITSNVEQQSQTTQDIALHIQSISQKAIKLNDESHKTGKAFFDISQKIDAIRIQALNCADKLDNHTMIELSISDHLMWKWRVYNMILGYIRLEENAVGDHRNCRLGKWLASLDETDPKVANVLQKLETPHANVHIFAKKAIRAYNEGAVLNAHQLLIELDNYSTIVVEILRNYKNSVENMLAVPKKC